MFTTFGVRTRSEGFLHHIGTRRRAVRRRSVRSLASQ